MSESDSKCDFCGEVCIYTQKMPLACASKHGDVICARCVCLFFARFKKGLEQMRNDIYDGKFNAQVDEALSMPGTPPA